MFARAIMTAVMTKLAFQDLAKNKVLRATTIRVRIPDIRHATILTELTIIANVHLFRAATDINVNPH